MDLYLKVKLDLVRGFVVSLTPLALPVLLTKHLSVPSPLPTNFCEVEL